MEFIKPGVHIDFIGKRKIAYFFSALLIIISLASLIKGGGPKYGIDFAGGNMMQISFDAAVSINDVKRGLAEIGIDKASVQSFGSLEEYSYLIRSDGEINKTQRLELEQKLKDITGVGLEVVRNEMVGPQVGKDLREKALFAMFYALLFITFYISGRFESEWIKSGAMVGLLIVSVYLLSGFKVSIPVLIFSALIISLILFWFLKLKYAMGAIVALIHDVTITVGIFSLFGKEFSLPVIAALLTIIGYSLNDTIVVFDRIRENLKKMQKNPLAVNINKSINETLNRTILTSMTTLIVVIILFLFGGGIIHDFAFALIVGVAIGTFSSIFVASPILLAWKDFKTS